MITVKVLQTIYKPKQVCTIFVSDIFSNTKLLHHINQLYFSVVLVMDLWEVRRTIAPKNVKQLMAAQLQKKCSRGFG